MDMEEEMANRAPSIIDLPAELARLTMFRGLTPATTREERQGSGTVFCPYREGILFAGKFAGTTHWETHPEDEMVHVLEGGKIMDILCDDGPPRSFELRAGMITVVPAGEWHRFRSADGGTTWSATIPGDHIELDVEDPRTVAKNIITNGAPRIIDLDAEVAKLTLFRGRTPRSTMADRRGSAVRLASYRDGALTATKFAGRGHWEKHFADELIHILDGGATLDVAQAGEPRSFALRAGSVVVIPQATWHRFHSADGVTLMTATPFPSETIEDDVDDPREVFPSAVR